MRVSGFSRTGKFNPGHLIFVEDSTYEELFQPIFQMFGILCDQHVHFDADAAHSGNVCRRGET